MAKKGALPLSEAGFVEEVTNRAGLSRAVVKQVVKALKEEAADCLSNGYKVQLSGLVTLEPQAKAGRKKGTVVRNPFDGTEKKLKSDESDKFKVKAKASPSIAKTFPSVKSKQGQELLKQLAKPKAKGKK
jgi:nucleoid DNA-binding protein